MTRATIAGGACATALVLLALAAVQRSKEREVDRALDQDVDPAAATPPATSSATAKALSDDHQGFLYGRVTTADGAIYEGSLRFAGDEEAFWDDYFNGYKDENPWAANAPPELLNQRRPIEVFGVKIAHLERRIDLGRPFMARFGDIARIEARGVDVRVTLKSGTVFDLDRLNAGDFDDGVRVWDATRGVMDLDSGVEDLHRRRISTVELLPTGRLADAPSRLHGTVRTPRGNFVGSIQWGRKDYVGSDGLDGRTADAELTLRFDTIRSIARHSRDSSLVTLLDGREIELLGASEVGHGNSGIHVNDQRYGRVLISWDAFERVDFTPAGSGPAYGASRRVARSRVASPPATAAISPAGWSPTSTRARPPRRSMPPSRVWTTPSSSA